jgi:plastocyanin
MKTSKVIITILTLTMLLTACGMKTSSDQVQTGAATEAPAAQSAQGNAAVVDIKDFAFNPVNLQIAAGTTVTWTNNDSAGHTVTADHGTFDSGTLRKGDTFSFTFNEAGTFAYYCRPHGGKGGQGMAGVITVVP